MFWQVSLAKLGSVPDLLLTGGMDLTCASVSVRSSDGGHPVARLARAAGGRGRPCRCPGRRSLRGFFLAGGALPVRGQVQAGEDEGGLDL